MLGMWVKCDEVDGRFGVEGKVGRGALGGSSVWLPLGFFRTRRSVRIDSRLLYGVWKQVGIKLYFTFFRRTPEYAECRDYART